VFDGVFLAFGRLGAFARFFFHAAQRFDGLLGRGFGATRGAGVTVPA
jgi:hypothetical protein